MYRKSKHTLPSPWVANAPKYNFVCHIRGRGLSATRRKSLYKGVQALSIRDVAPVDMLPKAESQSFRRSLTVLLRARKLIPHHALSSISSYPFFRLDTKNRSLHTGPPIPSKAIPALSITSQSHSALSLHSSLVRPNPKFSWTGIIRGTGEGDK